MHYFGNPFTILTSIDSTNNYAMQMGHARLATHGAAWFAYEQTHGKGRMGKQWHSNVGENIAVTVFIKPEGLLIKDFFLLNAAVSIGMLQFFSAFTNGECYVKWPNDLYWRDRKAGGLLVENAIQGNKWHFAVAGMGININQTHFSNSPNAVSLKMVTGKTEDPVELAKTLLRAVEEQYNLVFTNQEALLTTYNQHLYKRNQLVQLKDKQTHQPFDALIIEVTNNGLLKVETNGTLRFLEWGSVQWL